MVVIRLARYGRKKLPFYHIIVSDKRRFRNGKFIKKIGFFNPFIGLFKDKKDIYINFNDLYFWVKNGALLSKKVKFLLKKYKKNNIF